MNYIPELSSQIQHAPNDKIDLKKRQTQGGQYDAPHPPNCETWYMLHDEMKYKGFERAQRAQALTVTDSRQGGNCSGCT